MSSAVRKRFSITELMVLIALIGTLASIAIPSFLLAQRRLRVESLKGSARAFRQDLSSLISASLGRESLLVDTGGDGNAVGEMKQPNGETVLDGFACFYNEYFRLKSPMTGEPLFLLEKRATVLDAHVRDGLVQVRPPQVAEGGVWGVALAATNNGYSGGPGNNMFRKTYGVLVEPE